MTEVPPRRESWWFFVGLSVLHLAFAWSLPFERRPTIWSLSTDAALLAMSLALFPGRFSAVVAAILSLALPFYRVAGAAVTFYYEKPFEPWNDVLLFKGLDHLFTHQLPAWSRWPIYILIAALLVGATYVLYRLFKNFGRVASIGNTRAVVFLLAVLVLVGGVFESSARPLGQRLVIQPSVLARVVSDVGTMIVDRAWEIEEMFLEREARVREELAKTPKNLAKAQGLSCGILWIESYGRVVYSGSIGVQLRGELSILESELKQSGFVAASTYAFPSVRGGGSTLAHIELLTGLKVENRRVFDRAIASDTETLTKLFSAAGFRLVNAQPVMPVHWPEGDRFFGFEKTLIMPDFGYAGPAYPFGVMPDQFALERAYAMELKASDRPFFFHFVGASSHAPFSMIPRYIADWSALDAPGAMDPEFTYPFDLFSYTEAPGGEEAYAKSILYDLKTMFGFAQRLGRPVFFVVLGDHQPPAIGTTERYDQSHDVPVHLITNRPEILEPFLDSGFTRGLIPAETTRPIPFTRLFLQLLRGLSSDK